MYASVLYLMMFLGMGATFVMDTANPYTLAQTILLVALEAVPMALLAAIYLCTRHGAHMRTSLRLKNPGPAVLLVIPIAVIGYFAVNYVTSVWIYLWMLLGADPAAASAIATPRNVQAVLISLISIAASPAIFEEFLFRGVIMPAFERKFRNFWTPIVLTGLLFALMHGSIVGLPAHLMLGIVLCYVVAVTGSIWTGVIYHFIHNGLAMFLSYLIESADAFAFLGEASEPATTLETLGAIVGASFMAVIFTGLLILLLYAMKKIYGGRTPAAEKPVEYIPMEIPGQKPSGAMRLVPWLPLAAAAPLIFLNYLGTTVLMYISSFTDLLSF